MNLNKLISGLDNATIINNKKGVEVKKLTINSAEVEPGSLFICLDGTTKDGHDYAPEAVKNGAVALVVSHQLDLAVPQIVVDNPREAMSTIAANFYEHPEEKISLIGITGTNGKTTTTYIIKKILESAGNKVGLIGTSANYIGPIMLPPKLTTPDPIDLFELLSKMVRAGCKFVVMEVSAHAIYFDKLKGLKYENMVLSNITQDHLDFFKTFDNYKNVKLGFFNSENTKTASLNKDDPSFATAVEKCAEGGVPYLSFSKDSDADIKANVINSSIKGSTFDLNILGDKFRVNLPLPGKFNVYNALQAATACTQIGILPNTIASALNSIEAVKGRFNIVKTGLDFDVVVDYAHTPDGIQNILEAVNALKTNRVIMVFGCGGNRDSSKRSIMGDIASRLSDYVIVTSDNPRFENPDEIIKQIVGGINGANFETEENRRLAIEKAMKMAKSGDIIIIAGKGCEDYQEINGIKHHFLDEEVVLDVAKTMHATGDQSAKKRKVN